MTVHTGFPVTLDGEAFLEAEFTANGGTGYATRLPQMMNAAAADLAAKSASASASASTATTQASTATTQASNASASATASLGYLNDFKGRYYGALSANPTLDPLGAAINAGDLYWNTTSSEMKIYSGTAWLAAYLPASGYAVLTANTFTALQTINADVFIDGGNRLRGSYGSGAVATCLALGDYTLGSNTTGVNNIAVGSQTLYYNTTGANNTAVGANALLFNTTANGNTAVGESTLYSNTTGYSNAALGNQGLYFNTTGANNTAVGYYALGGNTTGVNNIAVGYYAGTDAVANITTQSNYFVAGNNNTANANIKVAWTVTSDARDKMDFAPVPHGLDFINRLKPTKYVYRKSREENVPQINARPRYGFLAQDVLALEGSNTVIVDDRDAENLKFNDQSLLAVLVNAIQELSKKVDNQALEIAALKGDK